MNGGANVTFKIIKPKVSNIQDVVTFEDVYDSHDPFIEQVIIEDCLISDLDEVALEFTEVIFRNVRFEGIAISRMYLRDVVFEKCDLSNARLEEVTMQRVTFHHCQMTGVMMADGRLNQVTFKNCNLQLAAFGYSKQKFVHYQECLLKQADFYENVWKKVYLEQCELTGANLAGTSLKDIDISRSTFEQLTVGIEDLRGCIVNQQQAKAFAQLLGLVVKE